jgi:nucleoside-diphosphate-sugar epimerase
LKLLITGAAGNLGSHLAKYIMKSKFSFDLRLMIHKTPLPYDISGYQRAEACEADLSIPGTLAKACENVNCIVHFAGVLFAPKPEKFLPVTNIVYFQNLVNAAIEAKADKIILISFPHVEGNTTPGNPANGRLNGNPVSVHAQTRLREEQYLFEKCKNSGTAAVSLRPGMIYGKNILMLDAGRWLMEKKLLGVWKKPTWIHLISIDDFNEAVKQAVIKQDVKGIYQLGDEKPLYLQEFLDLMANHLGYKKPWRMPWWCIYLAASLVEIYAGIFKTKSPLTKDFIRIGMVSYAGDITRMKSDLLPELKYPDIYSGIKIL